MKVTREKTEDRQAFLTVEMESTELEEALERAYHRLVKKTDIPGFRRGKAPRAMLESYIGRESLLKEALNSLIPDACDNAIKEQEIKALTHPNVEIIQTEPLVFKVVVPLLPEIRLGDYRQIRMSPEPVDVTEDNINSVVDRIRHEQANWEPVERPVEFNDMVVIDIDGVADDKALINRKGTEYHVRKDQNLPLPGFAEQIVGMKRDEEKEFQLHIPEDFPKKEVADKQAIFKIKVNEIKQEKLPELNDDFARGVDEGFESMDKLREFISDGLKKTAEERAESEMRERIIQMAVDQAETEFPPLLVEVEIDKLLEQQLRRWQASGRDLDEYLSNINKTEQQLRDELRPAATKRVVRSLVLGKISQEEHVKVDKSEVDVEIDNMLKDTAPERVDDLKKFLNTPESRRSIMDVLVGRKTVERLADIASGQEIDKKENKANDEEAKEEKR